MEPADISPETAGEADPCFPRPERLQKILSAHGAASRRGAERMILEGRVTVNGSAARLGQSASVGRDVIAVDGEQLGPRADRVCIMLNKPRGYITTVRDDRGRKTVMELVSGLDVKVYPVGRLDMDSEGLLLLTNDGGFAEIVSHPSYNKVKKYEVRVRGDVPAAVPLLRRPMVIDSHTVCAGSVGILEQTGRGALLSVSVSEGRNRQIRKMCAAAGLDVESLKRVSVGSLDLGTLEPGQWRRLTSDEVRALSGL